MPNLEASGTQTCVINTEHDLKESSDNKNFLFSVDLAAMQSGDTIELRMYTKILSGGTSRCIYYQSFAGAQSANGGQIAPSIPLASDIYFKATIKQTAGTGRAYPWKVLSL